MSFSLETCYDETTPPAPGLVVWDCNNKPIDFFNFGATRESTEAIARKRLGEKYPEAVEVSAGGCRDFIETQTGWVPVY